MVEAVIQRPSADFIQGIQWNADRQASLRTHSLAMGHRNWLRSATNFRAFADALKDATNLPDSDVHGRMEVIGSTIRNLDTTMPESEFKKVMIDSLQSKMAGFKVVAGKWFDVFDNDLRRLDLV